MGKKVRSARGELVDFDLLKIKEQMTAAPPPIDVKQRQNFIERRLRRRVKKVEPILETNVEPTLPSPEDVDVKPFIEAEAETEATEVTSSSKTKQRARPKKR